MTSPMDEQGWIRAASRMLKGEDPRAALQRLTDDGLSRGPLFAPSDAGHVPDPRPVDAYQPWHIAAFIHSQTAEEANREMLANLEGGASAVRLVLDASGVRGLPALDPETLSAALAGVHTDLAPVIIDALDAPHAPMAHPVKTLAGNKAVIGLSPLASAARGRCADLDGALFNQSETLHALAEADPEGRVTASLARADIVHAAGGTQGLSLGLALSEAAHYVRAGLEAGLSPRDALKRVDVTIALDADVHEGIATLRAWRYVWAELCRAFGHEEGAGGRIHAVSATRMLTAVDAWTNLLRLTCASFAGAVGGADSIALHPFTHAMGRSTDFAQRATRNIQHLAMLESHLGKVIDPAAGSGLHESMTRDMARAAWALMQEAERQGGYAQALQSGWLADTVREARERRAADIVEKRAPLVGITLHPSKPLRVADIAGEWASPETPAHAPLPSIRDAAPFEADHPAAG